MTASVAPGPVRSVIPVARTTAGSGGGPVARSQAMREVLAAAEDVAMGATTVLLLGESGTGKEVVDRHIHRCSPRGSGPWVAVNCAALPSELLESELFGHERGAFTGAAERRVGRIEQADKGTLLLDEISEMPLSLQAKLLRVLQEREVDRVGGGKPISVDVRIIATSNRDLGEMVARRQFRQDLYYRLFVFPIVLPPLRDRPDDIPALIDHLLQKLAESLGRPAPTLSEGAQAALAAYAYPGNVRELGNILERALVRCRVSTLELGHLWPGEARERVAEAAAPLSSPTPTSPSSPSFPPPPPSPASSVARHSGGQLPERRFLPEGVPIDLPSLERLAIQEALRRVSGNRTHAAGLLGISLRTLRNKLREYRARAASADGQVLPTAFDVGDGDEGAAGELARQSHDTPGKEEQAA
ncbi:MAG TPA: sigma-54 dependent transcriptional regulator [Polyangia bacterium]|nr:sigma-54 dependent transcriptional regulator [Polyangia bacterium]